MFQITIALYTNQGVEDIIEALRVIEFPFQMDVVELPLSQTRARKGLDGIDPEDTHGNEGRN